MKVKNPTWLSKLSIYALLPFLAYVVFASSTVWAPNNVLWDGFYTYYSSTERIGTFNLFSGTVSIVLTFAAFLLAVVGIFIYFIKEHEKPRFFDVFITTFALILSFGLLLSLMLFFTGVNIFTMFL